MLKNQDVAMLFLLFVPSPGMGSVAQFNNYESAVLIPRPVSISGFAVASLPR